uniref:Carbohydrate kinase PfkB domain-containing protein n=1 Tax=Varanus komodoensis TaxID=61221 RepID=A0A8D2IV80_VARKO
MIGKAAFTLGGCTVGGARRIIHTRSLHSGDLKIHPCVKEAMDSGRPVVALESAIITHGMPYPQNLSVAREVEEVVRTNGSVPATIGILNGSIHVGLQDKELEFLARCKNVVKVSRRDLPYVLSKETHGVCVAAFGESGEFPAFFSHRSGFQAPYRVQNEKHAAQLIVKALALQLGSGVLIAVPSPQDQAASGQLIEEAILQALQEAQAKGITGKALTPFLLQRVNELSSGESLKSNIALIKNNAKVGSRIAVALNRIQRGRGGGGRGDLPLENDDASAARRPDGGQTNPSTVRQSFGGVGRNLADCLSRLGKTPLFISVMGKDEHSESILRHCRHMDMRGVLQLKGHNTATYCAVITGSGELALGLGDMDVHQQITEQYVSRFEEKLCLAPLMCIDGNVPVSTIQYICRIAREQHLAVWYEPTDVNKASKPFHSDSWTALTCTSPNLRELRAINQTLGHPVPEALPSKLEDMLEVAAGLACPLLKELHCVVVTLGQHGVLVCGRDVGGSVSLHPGTSTKSASGELCAVHYPAIPVSAEEIVNVSGAGDSLMAGIIAGLLAGEDTDSCIRMGLLSASLSLCSYEPVSPEIDSTSVNAARLKTQQWPVPKRWKVPEACQWHLE